MIENHLPHESATLIKKVKRDVHFMLTKLQVANYPHFLLYLISRYNQMSQVREIKCPNCGEWTLWNGHIDDRCLYCDVFLEPQRFSREVEKKINRDLLEENDYFFIKPADGLIKRLSKRFLNWLRWWAYYVQIAFFIFITLLLVLLSLITG